MAAPHALASVSAPPPLCLAALHACGRLSCLMYRWFLAWPHARVLVNVPCCYFKMAGDVPAEGETECADPPPESHKQKAW